MKKSLKTLISSGLIGLTSLAYSNSAQASCQNPVGLTSEALLYDIYLGTFSNESSAQRTKKQFQEQIGDDLSRFLKIKKEGTKFKVKLDLNTINSDAKKVVDRLEQLSIDSFKVAELYFYNSNSTQCRFANVLVEEGGLEELVRDHTTAYGNEVGKTVRAYRRDLNDGKNPVIGTFTRVSVRHLKIPFKLGMIEGEDYEFVELGETNSSLWNIAANYTEGDLKNNIEILRKFNAIRNSQLSKLSTETPIMIPIQIYRNPLEATVVNGIGDLESNSYEIIPFQRSEPSLKKTVSRRLNVEIPSMEAISNYSPKRRKQGIGVLRDTKMPAVLLEAFNIQNWRQLKFYSNDANLNNLSNQFCQGVINYKSRHRPLLSTVIIDNGHGDNDPGTRDITNGTNKEERDFTPKIQFHLASCLKDAGFKVHTLNYFGLASSRKRIKYYVNEANKLGDSRNSIYIATHVDSVNKQTELEPRIFVHNKGTQRQSTLLAQEMLAKAVPNYRATFSK